MKIFFISDIHGNQFALKSILEYAKSINSNLIFCAGDISGYFTGINEVISLLKEYNVQTILGNHDAFLIGLLAINPAATYYPAYVKTKSELSLESYNWLKHLPKTTAFSTGNIQLNIYHGGPSDVFNQYIFPDTLDLKDRNFCNPGIFVFGHTHLQFIHQFEDKIFINPGAVGLPRNGDFRAHGISYDTDQNIFTEHKISYDLNGLIAYYILEAAVNPKFFHNINFGRSSNKILKKRQDLFLDNFIVEILEGRGIITINTRFGAVFSIMKNGVTEYLLYAASYSDDTIELTSNTLVFNWQKKLNIERGKDLEHKRFIKDRAGIYYYELFLDEKALRANIINIIETTFSFIKNQLKNVTI